MPVLVPCGVRLRSDFDEIAPGRARASDGWVGDTFHQQETSDHNPDETGSVPIHDADKVNEVHAIDVDVDLRESDLTMEKVVQFLLGRCRTGAEKRLRYIIYNRRIWEASNGWKQRAYTGPSPHTEHAHFSFSYDTALEASTVSYRLEDIPVALTAADKTWMQNAIGAQISTAKQEILDALAGIPKDTLDVMVSDYAVPAGQPVQRQSLYDWTAYTGVRQAELVAKLDEVLTAVTPSPAA